MPGRSGGTIPPNAWPEWRLPGDAPQAYAVTSMSRRVWLSDFGANSLVRFDPDTQTFTSVPFPDPGAPVRQILGVRAKCGALSRARTRLWGREDWPLVGG